MNDEVLIARADFLKMAGDYYRYWLEVYEGKDKGVMIEKCSQYYKSVLELLKAGRFAADPIRLGCGLNCCVFLFEIKGCEQEAISVLSEIYRTAN